MSITDRFLRAQIARYPSDHPKHRLAQDELARRNAPTRHTEPAGGAKGGEDK